MHKKAKFQSTARKALQKFCFIRYVEDLVPYVCNASDVKYKYLKGKRVSYSKYWDGYSYKCRIILESDNVNDLRKELRKVNYRITNVLDLRRTKRKDTATYFLVQFHLTKDLYICPEREINRHLENDELEIMNSNFKDSSMARLIAKGSKISMLQLLDEYEKKIKTEELDILKSIVLGDLQNLTPDKLDADEIVTTCNLATKLICYRNSLKQNVEVSSAKSSSKHGNETIQTVTSKTQSNPEEFVDDISENSFSKIISDTVAEHCPKPLNSDNNEKRNNADDFISQNKDVHLSSYVPSTRNYTSLCESQDYSNLGNFHKCLYDHDAGKGSSNNDRFCQNKTEDLSLLCIASSSNDVSCSEGAPFNSNSICLNENGNYLNLATSSMTNNLNQVQGINQNLNMPTISTSKSHESFDLFATSDEDGDSDYEPSTSSASDTEETLPRKQTSKLSKSKLIKKSDVINNQLIDENSIPAYRRKQHLTEAQQATTDDCELNSGREGAVEQKKLLISNSGNSNFSTGRKRNACSFCQHLQTNLARHLSKVHPNEESVKVFLAEPKGSLERKRIIDKIRRKGNYYHFEQSGELIPCRLPSMLEKHQQDRYVVCPSCMGLFSKKALWKHNQVCNSTYRHGQRILSVSKEKFVRVHPVACDLLKNEVFPVLRDDKVTDVIRYDELIIKYGNYMCLKVRQKHLHYFIRSELRCLGRLVISAKQLNSSISCLSDIINPKRFDLLLQSVNVVAKFDQTTRTYKSPEVATALGRIVLRCANILETECIKSSNSDCKLIVKDFIKLMRNDYGPCINKTVVESRLKRKKEKSIIVPIQNDIQQLLAYARMQKNLAHDRLCSESFVYDDFLNLIESTVIYILVFNRRRPGETERLLIQDVENFQTIDKTRETDIYKTLDSRGQQYAEKYIRIRLRGKLSREVSLFVDKHTFDCLQLIIKKRVTAGVPATNPYVFGLSSVGQRPIFIRACSVLRKYSVKCGASKPDLLRATLLRKQIATAVQILNMEQKDTAYLANFMGHHEDIHKSHYRLNTVTQEITRVAPLLEVMEQGDINKHAGKDLSALVSEADVEVIMTTDSCSVQAENASNRVEELQSSSLGNIELFHTPTKINSDCSYVESSDMDTPPKKKRKCDIRTPRKKLFDFSPKIYLTQRPGQLRCRWTTPEKRNISKFFQQYIKEKRLPGSKACEELKETHSNLRNRTTAQIRSYLQYYYKTLNF